MQLHTESNNLKAHKIVPPTISDKHRHIGRNSAEADKYTFNSLDWTVALEWITRNMAEKILMSQNKLILETFQAVVEWLYSVPFTHSKGLSQQPVRTAVVLRMIENPLHADWLQDQFCALTALEYNKMENSIQSLCRQITMDRISGWDLQIRAWRAFDYQRKNNKKIQVRDSSEDYQQMRRAIEKRLKAAVKTA